MVPSGDLMKVLVSANGMMAMLWHLMVTGD